MSDEYVIVDVSDIVGPLNAREKFHPAIIESWFARLYCKNYAVQCVSIRVFDSIESGKMFERMRLSIVADRLGITPMDFLPTPERSWRREGVWFLIKGNFLAMGNSRAIEKCWRNLYP